MLNTTFSFPWLSLSSPLLPLLPLLAALLVATAVSLLLLNPVIYPSLDVTSGSFHHRRPTLSSQSSIYRPSSIVRRSLSHPVRLSTLKRRLTSGSDRSHCLIPGVRLRLRALPSHPVHPLVPTRLLHVISAQRTVLEDTPRSIISLRSPSPPIPSYLSAFAP